MSLKEGKDNLAYKNYKMSDEFKKRLLDNYNGMLMNSIENSVSERSINPNNRDNEGILNFEEYKASRNDGLPIRKNKHKIIDGFIKIAVASFAVVASVGVLKTGLNSYMNKNTDVDTKEVAHGKIEKADANDKKVETAGEGDLIDFVLNGFSDVMDSVSKSSDFYDEDGQLKEGYETKKLTYELDGITYTKTIVGKDIVEISEDEYEKNYKLERNYDVSVNKYSYVYYIQGNYFCRTKIFKGFPTERYNYKKIERLEKYNGHVLVYMPDGEQYKKTEKLADKEYFCDVNMIALSKLQFVKGNQKEETYFKDMGYIEYTEKDGKSTYNMYVVNEKNILLYVEGIEVENEADFKMYEDGFTGIFKQGENFNITILAEHAAFDHKAMDAYDAKTGDYKNVGNFIDKDKYFTIADGYEKIVIKEKKDKVNYKGIDY